MDLGIWLVELVAEQATAAYVDNHIQVIGPTYSYDEDLLAKSLKDNAVKGTEEQIKMLNSGPVYLTSAGMVPVGENRPYRIKNGNQQSELLFTITSNMPKDYLLAMASAAKQANAVLVMRGLVDDSVEKTLEFAKPLIELGALVQINPIPSETFRHRTYRKAPLIVSTKINATGGYGCNADVSSSCMPSEVIGGVVHRPFGDYDVLRTVQMLAR